MELKLLAVVLFSIIFIPDESSTWSILPGQPRECGQRFANETWYESKTRKSSVRELPSVVAVIATHGDQRRTCNGAVITPWFVVTTKYCAPNEPANARYNIDSGHGADTAVTKVHLIEDSPFILLKLKGALQPNFAVCLTYEAETHDLDNKVSSASWSFKHLKQEEWTLVNDACNTTCQRSRCTCARSSESAKNTCPEDEGKPVMRWMGNKWYLVGMMTKVNGEDEKCASQDGNQRFFDSFTTTDLTRIDDVIIKVPYPERTNKDRPSCGLVERVEVAQKTPAPVFFPWIVAIYASYGRQVRNCIGTVLAPQLVLTSVHCRPSNSENVKYKIVYNSSDISTGISIRAEESSEGMYIRGPSFMFLAIATPLEDYFICLKPGPFNLPGQHVIAASWAFSDVGGRFQKGKLYYEGWTLPYNPDLCDGKRFPNRNDANVTFICAVSCTDAHYACSGDVGQPVMYRSKTNWYLVGMVTQAFTSDGDCELSKTRRRIFEWIDLKA